MSRIEPVFQRFEAIAPSVDWRFVSRSVTRTLLPLWFAVYSALILGNLAQHDFLFIDVTIYREAADRALDGLDPWAATVSGVQFAGPPPSVLFFIPMALVPLPVAIILTTGVLLGSATWAIRRLSLPLWWLLFPPIFESIIVGNLDVLVMALLLARGPIAGLAPVAKIYGVIPLLVQRRWTPLAVAIAVSALSAPLWPDFLANLDGISQALDDQAQGFSAWGSWFMIPVLLALWVLRRRGAEWLVVPAIWPHTQTHYGALSLPVVARYPVAAALIGLQLPLAPAVAVVLIAIQTTWRRSSSEQPEP